MLDGKGGPLAWQSTMSACLMSIKDVTIELNPKDDNLITVG